MVPFKVSNITYNNWDDFWKTGQYQDIQQLQREVEWTNSNGVKFNPFATTQNTPYIQTGAIDPSWKLLSQKPFQLKGDSTNYYNAYLNKFNNIAYKKVDNNQTNQGNPTKQDIQKIYDQTDANIKNKGIVSGETVTPAQTKTTITPTSVTPGSITPGSSKFNWTEWSENYPAKNPALIPPPEEDTKQNKFWLDWDHLYDMAGMGLNIGNTLRNYKLAQEAEKPILKDPVEHHHAIYGDYLSKVQGEQNAGNLLNAASKPISSDMAQTHAAQLQSQIAANDAITQGNAADNAKRQQTSEIAWQQEKENKNIRHDVAMENRLAIAKSRMNQLMNKQLRNASITNILDNGRKVWQTDWQKFKNRREALQDMYEQEFASQNGINSYIKSHPDLPANLVVQAHNYLYAPSQFQAWCQTATPEEQAVVIDIIKNGIQQGHLDYYESKGVNINKPKPQTNPIIKPAYAKDGTSLQKETLKKRQKDEDRFSKTINKDNDRFQRTTINAIKRLYRASKYQFGGGIVTTEFTPVRTPSETIQPPIWFTGAASGNKKKDDSAGSSKLLELLKTSSALDNDRKLIEGAIGRLLSGLELGNTANIEAQALAIQSKIKQAEDHKKAYDESLKHIQTIEGMGEAYIDSLGKIMVQDPEGNYKKVYLNEVEGNRIVTYGEALDTRNRDMSASFNSNIITDINNGISVKSLLDKVKALTEKLGHNQVIAHAIGRVEDGQIVSGTGSILNQLLTDVNTNKYTIGEGLYKLKQENKNNYEQLSYALNSLYRSMTTQEQVLAALKAKESGVDLSTYIIELLAPQRINEISETEFTQLQDHEKAAKDAQRKLEETDITPMQRDIMHLSGQDKVMNVMIGGPDLEHTAGNVSSVHKVHEGTLTIEGKKVSGEQPLTGSQLLNKSDIKSFGDTSRATFLGKEIDDWNKVVLTNNYFYQANLPTNADGTPNFQAYEQLNKLIKYLNGAGITTRNNQKVTAEAFNNIKANFTPESLGQIQLACKELNINLDSIINFSPFLFCYARADEKAFKMTNDSWFDMVDAYDTPNGLGTEISDDRTTLRESMATTINKALGLDSKNKIKAEDLSKIWSGAIYIPMQIDAFGDNNHHYSRSTTEINGKIMDHKLTDVQLSENTIKNGR